MSITVPGMLPAYQIRYYVVTNLTKSESVLLKDFTGSSDSLTLLVSLLGLLVASLMRSGKGMLTGSLDVLELEFLNSKRAPSLVGGLLLPTLERPAGRGFSGADPRKKLPGKKGRGGALTVSPTSIGALRGNGPATAAGPVSGACTTFSKGDRVLVGSATKQNKKEKPSKLLTELQNNTT